MRVWKKKKEFHLFFVVCFRILPRIQKEEMIVVTEVETEAGVIEIEIETGAETEIAMGVIEVAEIVLEVMFTFYDNK